MGSDFGSFDQSPLGAFVQSALGVRGFSEAAAAAFGDITLIAAGISFGGAAPSQTDMYLFSTANALPNPDGVEAGGSPTVVPETLGYLLNGDILIDDTVVTAGANANAVRVFDYDGTYAVVAAGPSGVRAEFQVYDLSGTSPSLLWTYTPPEGVSDWEVGPVIVNGLVCWGEYTNVGFTSPPSNRLLFQRYAAATGVDQGEILISGTETPNDAQWIALTETHDRTALVWEWTVQDFGNPTVSTFAVVDTDANVIASLPDLDDDTYAPNGMRVSSDGYLYIHEVTVGSPTEDALRAYLLPDLTRVPAKDFDLSSAEFKPSSVSGHSYWTVIHDLLYFLAGSSAPSLRTNVVDRTGQLVASMRQGTGHASAMSWLSFADSGESPTPALGILQRPIPEFPLLNNDVINTATTGGLSPETNFYDRDVNAQSDYTGADDVAVVTFAGTSPDTGPPGSTPGEWYFDAVDPPVIDAKSNDTGSVGVPYGVVLTATPSEVHGDVHLWELVATNRQGTDSASWTSTLSTPNTWTLPTKPSGATILSFGATAVVQWNSPTAGVHNFTAQADTHLGTDTKSWTLTVT